MPAVGMLYFMLFSHAWMLFIYCSVDFRHEQNRGIIGFKIVNVHLENSLENGDHKTVAQIKQSK